MSSLAEVVAAYLDHLEAEVGASAHTVAAWPAVKLFDCTALADHLAPAPRSDDVCVLVVRFR